MFATKHLHLATGEVLKWLAILTLASALAALIARMASGAEPMPPPREPGPLPAAALEFARPMSSMLPARAQVIAPAERIWQLLDEQKSGNFELALAAWPTAPLSCDAEPWRYVALGQAALGLRELEAAHDYLNTALGMDHENAVARYFLGILRMEQAANALEWPDALGPTYVRLAAHRRGPEPTLTKSMYELAARMEFEAALEAAAYVPLDMPLCEAYDLPSLALEPTVRDLLIAIGAEGFEGKAHHQLGYLLLEQGQRREAERHLDSAAALGQAIVFGYQDLAAAYERQHEHLDAARANAKALGQGGTFARPAQGMLRNLRLAIIEAF